MTPVLLCFCIIFIIFCIVAHSHINQENSDTPSKEKIIEFWVNSLNARKFNRDNTPLKENIKEFVIKIKKSIERYTVKVKKLFKEIEDYLRR